MKELNLLFLVLGALALLQALYSLRGGVVYLRLFHKFLGRPPASFAPPASVFLPCKTVDPHLESNLQAYFEQDYADFQLLLITGEETDPCVPVFRLLQGRYPEVSCQVLFSGKARQRGQKVHNLLYGLSSVRTQDQILAFGDSDIRPAHDWLRYLVGPLEDPEVGITTGYRWYLPQRGGFGSVLRSVWNAGIASLMSERDCLFAWGGSMAVLRRVFEACRVVDYWKNALSDDYAMSRAVRDRSLSIHFQPRCLSFSYEDCSLAEFLGWSGRQLSITRVYHPSLWWIALLSQGLSSVTLWGGMIVVIAGWVGGTGTLGLGILLSMIYGLGCSKAWLRLRAVSALFPEQKALLSRYRVANLLWGPLASLASLKGLIGSLWSRDIEWRGIRYRMLSPKKTVVLD